MTPKANCQLLQALHNICQNVQVHSHVVSTRVLLLQKVHPLDKALIYQLENSCHEQMLTFWRRIFFQVLAQPVFKM